MPSTDRTVIKYILFRGMVDFSEFLVYTSMTTALYIFYTYKNVRDIRYENLLLDISKI